MRTWTPGASPLGTRAAKQIQNTLFSLLYLILNTDIFQHFVLVSILALWSCIMIVYLGPT